MKKLTAVITAVALYFSAAASPNPENELNASFSVSNSKSVKAENVSSVITAAFHEKFKGATELSWRENQGFYFGYFKHNEQQAGAAYNDEGILLAESRQIKVKDLPLEVSKSLLEMYKDWIIPEEATEITIDGESSYYLTVENKKGYRQLKCYKNGEIEVLNRIKKKVLVGSVK